MARKEFSQKVKDDAHDRSKGFCENKACGVKLRPRQFAYDHILPDAMGGKPVLANCQVLCLECHAVKTAKADVPRIAKTARQRKGERDPKPATMPPILPEAAEDRRPMYFISANSFKAEPDGGEGGTPHRPAASGPGAGRRQG